MKSLPVMLLIFFFAAPLVSTAGGGGGSGGSPGRWYPGESPNIVDPSLPPLVFIHGYSNSANVWLEENDMPEIAGEYGYQTAYADLYPDRDMWENGMMLAGMLEEIYYHFGQKKLAVVAYSKGGVDSQTALVHNEAYPYVSRVITLSTPHSGTQLADLANSSAAGWLSELLGSRNDATASLQTGYMSYYRSLTDSHSNAQRIPFYTIGGTGWGSFGSATYWGGLYLSQYGRNDGVVPLISSRLSGFPVIAERSWNHSSIRQGSVIFPELNPFLTVPSSQSDHSPLLTDTDFSQASSMIIHGGMADEVFEDSFLIEDEVKAASVSVLSSKSVPDMVLQDEQGNSYTPGRIYKDGSGFFSGAYVTEFTVKNPVPGSWTVSSKEGRIGFLYTVSLDKDKAIPGTGINLKSWKSLEPGVKYQTEWVHFKGKGAKSSSSHGIKAGLPDASDFKENGIYNLTIQITGKTGQGKAFERSIVQSIYVDGSGIVYK
ncbi:esterase/lipase family protein [Bacillus infantis]|uniref:esterase/lipase family protein n=1 Tax=Bacillus infantis TaxID=324767 RepID=UPI003CF30E4B